MVSSPSQHEPANNLIYPSPFALSVAIPPKFSPVQLKVLTRRFVREHHGTQFDVSLQYSSETFPLERSGRAKMYYTCYISGTISMRGWGSTQPRPQCCSLPILCSRVTQVQLFTA